MTGVQFRHIITDQQLRTYCDELSSATTIAFDSEFVSEDTYRPDLCLLQVSALGQLAVIDAHTVEDLTPFWQRLASAGHETVVHAGREEFLFCLRSIGKGPSRWFDVQIAAGMVGIEYPASLGNLVSRILGQSMSKGETRTDWRRRPLSSRQLQYALQDVAYLDGIRAHLQSELRRLGRTEWLESELRAWQDGIRGEEQTERWRRVSGISGLSSRCLAVVRELWRWRDAEAERLNVPPRRVLRDDLVAELARRRTADVKRIRAVRGLQRRNLSKRLPELSQCIARALDLPESELPKRGRRGKPSQPAVIAPLLATALASICRQQSIAPSLVGTVQDVRDLVTYRLQQGGPGPLHPPALARGWRAIVVGQRVDDLLMGKLSIRIADPTSDHPLVFDPTEPG